MMSDQFEFSNCLTWSYPRRVILLNGLCLCNSGCMWWGEALNPARVQSVSGYSKQSLRCNSSGLCEVFAIQISTGLWADCGLHLNWQMTWRCLCRYWYSINFLYQYLSWWNWIWSRFCFLDFGFGNGYLVHLISGYQ